MIVGIKWCIRGFSLQSTHLEKISGIELTQETTGQKAGVDEMGHHSSLWGLGIP